MQSSYNVIKNNSVKSSGLKQIVTSADTTALKVETEANAKNHIESYESLAKSILENARRQSEQIISSAYEDASFIETEAIKKVEFLKQEAYENAVRQGYEEGYSEGYGSGMEKALTEGEAIIASAAQLLHNAKAEYEQYMLVKSGEIKELILTISQVILKRELQSEDAINKMIFDALEQAKSAKSFIIRCNERHADSLKAQVESFKEQLGFFGDIFILNDDSIEPGNAVIDKGNGRIVVGIDYALQRIEQVLEGKD